MTKEKIHTDVVGLIDIDSDSAAYIKIYDRLKISVGVKLGYLGTNYTHI